jgi:cyclase
MASRQAPWIGPLASLVVVGASVVVALAQAPTAPPRPLWPLSHEGLEILPVQGSIYALIGAGGNITISAGKDGLLLVDSGRAGTADRVLTALERLQQLLQAKEAAPFLGWAAETRGTLQNSLNPYGPPKPIRYIINTHVHPDHVGGNEPLRRAGTTYTGGNVAGDIADAAEGAAIIAHERVLTRMSAEGAGFPPEAWPTTTFFGRSKKLSHFFNGDGIEIVHLPAAHCDSDVVVFFRRSDVISTGDLFQTTSYPEIDLEHGGSIDGLIEALNFVLDLVVPEFRMEGGTLVVPGHGRLADGADVAYYRDMLTIVRDRIKQMIERGLTLEQVKAAKPTADFDPRWGSASGPGTPDQFVTAVYRSLSGHGSSRTKSAARSTRG